MWDLCFIRCLSATLNLYTAHPCASSGLSIDVYRQDCASVRFGLHGSWSVNIFPVSWLKTPREIRLFWALKSWASWSACGNQRGRPCHKDMMLTCTEADSLVSAEPNPPSRGGLQINVLILNLAKCRQSEVPQLLSPCIRQMADELSLRIMAPI